MRVDHVVADLVIALLGAEVLEILLENGLLNCCLCDVRLLE
jgi:hypothetical protein